MPPDFCTAAARSALRARGGGDINALSDIGGLTHSHEVWFTYVCTLSAALVRADNQQLWRLQRCWQMLIGGRKTVTGRVDDHNIGVAAF
ncbi:hypothetical protein D3C81_1662310 [compost metagenome]